MKKQSFRFLALLLAAVTLCAALSACGAKTRDVPLPDLRDQVCAAIGRSDMAELGDKILKGFMKKTADEVGDYVMMKTVTGTSIDEFGIFKAGNMTVDELKAMIEAYIQTLQDSWMNYQPEEKPKLDDAEIKIVGDYVMYCILDEADRAAAFDAFTGALK